MIKDGTPVQQSRHFRRCSTGPNKPCECVLGGQVFRARRERRQQVRQLLGRLVGVGHRGNDLVTTLDIGGWTWPEVSSFDGRHPGEIVDFWRMDRQEEVQLPSQSGSCVVAVDGLHGQNVSCGHPLQSCIERPGRPHDPCSGLRRDWNSCQIWM